MLVRLDPAELRGLARLLAEAEADLAALIGSGRRDWPAGAAVAVGSVVAWAAEAAVLLRRRAAIAEAAERLAWPEPGAPTQAAADDLDRVLARGAPGGAAGSGPPAGRGPSAGPGPGHALADLQVLLAAAPADPADRALAVRGHLSGLSPVERAELVVAAPDVLGGLDGAPEELRYAANALRLQREVEAEERRLAALPPEAAAGLQGALARRRLAGLRALLVPRTGTDGRPMPRQWLALDTSGRGSGVEVVGATAGSARLDRARAVAVLVPGMGSRLVPPAPGWTGGAGRLAAEATRLAGPGTVVVAWQGYPAPQGLDVLSPAAARPAGVELAAFLRGLAATTPAHLTVAGHSYGSVVVAAAARARTTPGQGPLPVDAVAVYGSPGLGRDIRTVDDLRLAPGTPVYALAAPRDAVAWSGWHGDNPVEADVGAVRLATGDVSGHSAYLDAGSQSLASLALVAAGRGDRAHRAAHAPDGGPLSAALADLALPSAAGPSGAGPRPVPDLDWRR